MNEKEVILEAMKKAGEPLNAGRIAEHDGVAFEDLPDDWKCPRCRQGKEKFNRA